MDTTPPPAPPRARRLRLGDGIAMVLAVALVAGGLSVLWRARERRVVHEAELGGMRLRLESADWLRDGMLHPGTTPFGMPPSMMPGMPEADVQRLHVELTLQNASGTPQTFDLSELSLRAAGGAAWVADPDPQTRVTLPPRHVYATVVQFDVPEAERTSITLLWTRGGREARLLSTGVPLHEEPKGTPPEAWPATVATLPTGRPEEGAVLFERKFACGSCHGTPGLPGSNTVGPALTDFLRVGASRVPGKDAAQYAYESLLSPDAFLAPECAHGQPCTSPSAMPLYGELMSPQDMADVLAFLLDQRLAQRP